MNTLNKNIATGFVAAIIAIPALTIGTPGVASQQSSHVSPVTSAPILLAHRGEDDHKRGKRRGGKRMDKMLRGLDLTDMQKDKMFNLRHASMPDMRELRKRKRAARHGVREMVSTGQLDKAQLDSLSNEIGQISAQMVRARAELRIEMMNILTDEQRTKLKERKDRRGHRKHK